MEKELLIASRKLAKAEFKSEFEGLSTDVRWLRGMQLNSGAKVSMHSHLSYEFHIVKSGSCLVRLIDGEHCFSAGEAYITPPYLSHEQLSVGDTPYVEYCLNCDIEKTESFTGNTYIDALLSNSGLSYIKDASALLSCFEMIFEYARRMCADDRANIKHMIYIIINTTAGLLADKSHLSIAQPSLDIDERFELFRAYIIENIDLNPRVRDMASIFFLSEKQIGRIIKENTGKNAFEYISSLRFDRAKLYIQSGRFSLNEIARKMNFATQQYFTEFFKRYGGISPNEYKNIYFDK